MKCEVRMRGQSRTLQPSAQKGMLLCVLDTCLVLALLIACAQYSSGRMAPFFEQFVACGPSHDLSRSLSGFFSSDMSVKLRDVWQHM